METVIRTERFHTELSTKMLKVLSLETSLSSDADFTQQYGGFTETLFFLLTVVRNYIAFKTHFKKFVSAAHVFTTIKNYFS